MRKLFFLLLCLNLCFTQGFAQSRIVTGNVIDSKGTPVVNASVVVKGAKRGVSTDADGNFNISVSSADRALIISFVNYATLELPLTSSDAYKVTLQPSSDNLAEVVVVAYGTAKKETLTGSVGQIKSEAIAKRPVSKVLSLA